MAVIKPFYSDQIIIIDVGTGNIRSVHKAFQSLGANVTSSYDSERILSAGKIVLPGVGAFGDFMSRLSRLHLLGTLREAITKRIPLLGICVGMQALFDRSREMGDHPGLGILPGAVMPFPDQSGLKIPHTGWNQITVLARSRLFQGMPSLPYVFFNHAFYCEPQSARDISAKTDYGIQFCSAVENGNIFGVQFHPEKSQGVGLKILENFIKL
jgi:glutamine amidotransferase